MHFKHNPTDVLGLSGIVAGTGLTALGSDSGNSTRGIVTPPLKRIQKSNDAKKSEPRT